MPFLLAVTAALVALLYLTGIPAAFLLGAMGAAMILVCRGGAVRLPDWIFALAQAVVGCLIARSFTPALFHAVLQHLALFVGVTLSVLLVTTMLGLALARLGILPGSTALWGSFPGAATVMVLLSGSFGGDMRLVAVMQYLRVVVVAVTASLVGRLFGLADGGVHHPPWLAPVAWPSFAVLLAIICVGGLVGPRLRLPAGPLLLPMALTTVLQDLGLVRVELPQPLLVASYLVVGWAIGLRFTRQALREAARPLPQVLGSIAMLVAACGDRLALTRIGHPRHALALRHHPGADSIAIIAAGTSVDVPFVMATQMSRFLAVLLLGPTIAKRAAQLTCVKNRESHLGARPREPDRRAAATSAGPRTGRRRAPRFRRGSEDRATPRAVQSRTPSSERQSSARPRRSPAALRPTLRRELSLPGASWPVAPRRAEGQASARLRARLQPVGLGPNTRTRRQSHFNRRGRARHGRHRRWPAVVTTPALAVWSMACSRSARGIEPLRRRP